ncbi:LysR family transcriptional regulator [Massilia sp. Dwa41.01b]|uniref:LysR family transcriptional regulator n=1 Tax=unclassified Massilia TaxID=2609279 RepID=UPI00160016CC|nr:MULTISPECIES: LysR family transcriptional regulator [unclassified Massilia]QNA89133.1 LysR family transcriptional regulator [Massilia sp. Dwa41.01b]QNB00026.1 LysR family transcriptional regulator [Massilia sp. Se16.2.3]
MIEPNSIDLNLLLVFQEVYRARNISSAARRLGLTQSAVSNALARLRRTFGDELFVRTAQGMQPTPYAEQLAEPVGAALAQVELALNQRSGFDPATSTRGFTVAMSDVGEVYFMPALIERCRSLAPGVRISSVRAGAIALKEEMESGRVDLAVGAFDDVSEALYGRLLFRQPYVSMVRHAHPLASGEVTLARFLACEHLLVDSADSPYERVNALLEKAGIGPSTRFRVPHFTAVPYIVSASELVVTVPQKLAEQAAAPFGLVAITPPLSLPTLQTKVFWHRRYNQDPGNAWLRELVVAAFGE